MNRKIIAFIVFIVLMIVGIVGAKVLLDNISKNNTNTEIEKKTSNLENKDNEKILSNKSAVIYFSATGNTEKVAKQIQSVSNSDIVEIKPKQEYTSDDLDYNNDNSRANKEQNDKNARPEIESISNIDNYDIIYLGYPIWWEDVPKVILTLLDNYNFDNKTIIPFCTSGSSSISQSMDTLKSYNKNVNWIDGKRFSGSESENDIREWINSLNINSKNR